MKEPDIVQEVQMDNKPKRSSSEAPTSTKNKSLPTVPTLSTNYSSKKIRKKGKKGRSLQSVNELQEDEIRDNNGVIREKDEADGTGPLVGTSNQAEKEAMIFSPAEDNQRRQPALPNAVFPAICQSPAPVNHTVHQQPVQESQAQSSHQANPIPEGAVHLAQNIS